MPEREGGRLEGGGSNAATKVATSERVAPVRGFCLGCQDLRVFWKGAVVTRRDRLGKDLLSYGIATRRLWDGT